jgi:putative FmdB family regulatory protein
MPIFEYRCGACGKEFETLVRTSGPAPACPGCASTQLNKKLSTFAAIAGGASSGPAEMPAACGSCGHPGGPGACAFN